MWPSTPSLRLRTTQIQTTTVPTVTKHYFANGQRIATRVNEVLYYTLSDHLGSTSLVLDAQGNEVGHAIYDAYGQIVENTIPLTLTDHLYTGQRFDPSTGLFYYNARYYDPSTGQFTQPDSVIPDPLNPAAWNRFSYVYGNPVNYIDPSGHNPLMVAIVAGSLLNVTINYFSDPDEYTGQEFTRDMIIGGTFGALGFGVSRASVHLAFRLIGYGIVSASENATSAYFNPHKSFDTNDLIWSFVTGVGFGSIGEAAGFRFGQVTRNAKKLESVQSPAYKMSVIFTQMSTRSIRRAIWRKADEWSQYVRVVGKDAAEPFRDAFWKTHLWNISKMYVPPVAPPTPNANVLQGNLVALGAFLSDNEYLGLFPTPSLVNQPQVLIK